MASLKTDQFLKQGLQVLAESGSGDLSITSLCRDLGVTKGSFYHHFRSLADYTDALLTYWEEECNYRPIELSRKAPNEFDRVEALSDWAASLPHESEAALRAWGSSNVQVAAVQARVDTARESRIHELVRSLGVEDARARVLAQMGVTLLIGFQHRERPLDPRQLHRMFAEVNCVIYREAENASA